MNSQYFRYVKVVWAAVEVFCFAGISFGWSSLLLVYKEEGLHSELCDTKIPFNSSKNVSATTMAVDTVDCTEQDLRFNLYFTIPASLSYVLVFVGGHIWARFGIRTIRLLSAIMIWIGFAMLGFANKDIPWIILPGLLFSMSGGILTIVTASQLANLFDVGKMFVVSTMTGLFDSSSSVAIFVKLAHDKGIPRWSSFVLLLVTSVVSFSASTFVVFPGKREQETTDGGNEREHMERGPRETNSGKKKSILQYLKSPIYLMHFLWFSILFLFLMFYFGAINTQIIRVTGDNQEQVSSFTDILYYTQFGGVLTAWCSGFMYDFMKTKCRKYDFPLKRRLFPPVLPLAVGSCSTILMPVLMMLLAASPSVLYILFVDMVILRSFLFALGIGFLVDIFPTDVFSVLYTTNMMVAAVVSIANYGLFYWALNYDNGWLQVHILQVCLALPSILHPALAWFSCRQPRDTKASGWKKWYLGPIQFQQDFSTTQLKSSTSQR